MDLNQYAYEATRTDKEHKELNEKLAEKIDHALGLCGECGEVADLVKHHVFHHEEIDKFKLTKEIGDVMWYLVHVAQAYDIPMEVALEVNIEKLRQRYPGGYDDARSEDRHNIEQAKSLEDFYKHKMIQRGIDY